MNLLRIIDLTSEQIDEIFEIADRLKNADPSYSLEEKTFILFFPETSIRTRITFEKGIMNLHGSCQLFPPETLDKEEKLEDVIKYIENWADAVIVRHNDFSVVSELSEHSSIPIINAMTNENHPCEILTDLYSISRKNPDYKNLASNSGV